MNNNTRLFFSDNWPLLVIGGGIVLLVFLFILHLTAREHDNQRLLKMCLDNHEKSQYECENDAVMRRESQGNTTVIIPQR